MKNNTVKNIVITALCITLCYILPFITGQIPQINSMFSPMHIPILLCGILCGGSYALAAGVISPILRSLILTMPPLFPTAISMAFELAAYGVSSGLIYSRIKRKTNYFTAIYVALISAMIFGRAVFGVTTAVLMGIQGNEYTFSTFFTTVFIQGLPGILCHMIVVPLIIFALKKAKIVKD